MGRKFAHDTSPKKTVMTFCLDPDLAVKVRTKCKTDGFSLSYLLQVFLLEWTNGEIAFDKEKGEV